jgi:hypothetical protein
MDNLPYEYEELDLIWSEGAIAQTGFEKSLNYWKDFLKKDGYIAVTYESWFTDEHPAEIEKWWVDAVSVREWLGAGETESHDSLSNKDKFVIAIR